MKRVLCVLVIIMLAACALADTEIIEGEYEAAGRLTASENKADCAYYCSVSGDSYYIKDFGVFRCDGKSGVTERIADLPRGAVYASVVADADGNVYVLKHDSDETMKPSVICLSKTGRSYYALEYVYPGAGMHITPESMLFSDEGMSGCIFARLEVGDSSIDLMSVINIMWGSLTGYDEFVFIDTASDTAVIMPSEGWFDAYGYANETCSALMGSVESRRLVVPEAASLSADGQSLLLKAGDAVYVMNTVTLGLERVDISSGSIGWSGNELFAWDDEGNSIPVGDDREFGLVDDWSDGEKEFGMAAEFGTNWDIEFGTGLDDWS